MPSAGTGRLRQGWMDIMLTPKRKGDAEREYPPGKKTWGKTGERSGLAALPLPSLVVLRGSRAPSFNFCLSKGQILPLEAHERRSLSPKARGITPPDSFWCSFLIKA